MIFSLLVLGIALVVAYLFFLWKKSFIPLIIISLLGLLYYTVVLTAGDINTFFTNDPYARIYPNLWEHAIRGDFGIDTEYAFREYFINYQGSPTVYFGFMPAILRGIASIFNSDIYNYNLGNLSIIIALSFVAASLLYAARSLRLLKGHISKYTVGVLGAVLFASPLIYTAIWGRIHNEVIMWGTAWGLIFVAFYAVWIFSGPQKRRWWGTIMGISVGMAVLSRPTVAVTIAVPFAFLSIMAIWQAIRHHKTKDVFALLPGIICGAVLVIFALYINMQRWGSPLSFVKMHRHVELLKENPQRGDDLKKAGEFNLNRLGTSLQYYIVPSADNISREWPFVELDQKLTIMQSAPQYDYIEGSRLPITMSMPFLIVVGLLGAVHVRRLNKSEQLATAALAVGGVATLFSLCTVYALALRYSIDLVPVIVFFGLVFLVQHARSKKDFPCYFQVLWHLLLAISILITFFTLMQYKIISGQIDLPNEFRTSLSRQIHFPLRPDAKLFIINGQAAPSIRY